LNNVARIRENCRDFGTRVSYPVSTSSRPRNGGRLLRLVPGQIISRPTRNTCGVFSLLESSCTFPTVRSVSNQAARKQLKMAQVLSGTQVSKEIQQELKAEIERVREQVPDFAPGLAIVQVGGREDSNVYIRMKIKAASDIGINAQHVKLPKSITEVELLQELDKLNKDPKVHGIIVQMPLDTDNPIDSHKITDAVDPSKDVDGLCTINEGRVAIGDLKSGFLPLPLDALSLSKGLESKSMVPRL